MLVIQRHMRKPQLESKSLSLLLCNPVKELVRWHDAGDRQSAKELFRECVPVPFLQRAPCASQRCCEILRCCPDAEQVTGPCIAELRAWPAGQLCVTRPRCR